MFKTTMFSMMSALLLSSLAFGASESIRLKQIRVGMEFTSGETVGFEGSAYRSENVTIALKEIPVDGAIIGVKRQWKGSVENSFEYKGKTVRFAIEILETEKKDSLERSYFLQASGWVEEETTYQREGQLSLLASKLQDLKTLAVDGKFVTVDDETQIRPHLELTF